jgi:hypothetical protein
MRLVAAALSTIALAAVTYGCSDPVPQSPDGAWFVSTSQLDATKCHMAQHNSTFGQVDDAHRIAVETDGVKGAHVSCTVSGTGNGPYAVQVLAQNDMVTLQLSINAISTTATEASPAKGGVAYLDLDKTKVQYAGTDCNFYFATKAETVATGKIWVAFTCDSIVNGDTMSDCTLTQGYALFENCLTGTEM